MGSETRTYALCVSNAGPGRYNQQPEVGKIYTLDLRFTQLYLGEKWIMVTDYCMNSVQFLAKDFVVLDSDLSKVEKLFYGLT